MFYTSSSPHIRTTDSVKKIMWGVVIALLPTCIYSVWIYGIYSAMLICICITTAVITEAAIQKFRGIPVTVKDGSAIIMGMRVACNITATISLWIPIIGTFVGMAIAKHCFGGLGWFNGSAETCFGWNGSMETRWLRNCENLSKINKFN